jgi:hypothetical protein
MIMKNNEAEPFDQEGGEEKQYTVKQVTEGPNGSIAIDFGPHEEIGNDSRGILLSKEKIAELNLAGKLRVGMEIEVTTDPDDNVIDVRIIEE